MGFKTQKRYKIIEDWLKAEAFTKDTTIVNYRAVIKKFLVKVLKIKNPNNYNKMKRDFEQDAKDFGVYLTNNTPKMYSNNKSILNTFFEHYNLPFPPNKYWKKFKRRSIGVIRPVRDERLLDKNQIKKLLSHGDLLQQSFYLVMLSGGFRPSEVRKLTFDDIDFNYKPSDEITMTKIRVRKEVAKKKLPRTAFISDEATEKLQEWLKPTSRNVWLRKSQRRQYNSADKEKQKEMIGKSSELIPYTHRGKKGNYPVWKDDRLFPFSQPVQSNHFHEMLEASNFVKKTNTPQRTYFEVMPKMFRSYFRSVLPDEMPVDYVERLGKSNPVRIEKIAISYHQSQHLLRIFETGVSEKDFKSLKKSDEVHSKDIKTLQEELIEEKKKRKSGEDTLKNQNGLLKQFADQLKEYKDKDEQEYRKKLIQESIEEQRELHLKPKTKQDKEDEKLVKVFLEQIRKQRKSKKKGSGK